MKKMFLLAATLFAAIQVMAADVDQVAARSIAQKFLASHSGTKTLNAAMPAVKWVHQEMNSANAGRVAYYVVNTDNGFVIVAGDDRAQEVLAYGNRPLGGMNSLPENMRYWLGYYKRQMELLQSRPGMKVQKPAIKAGGTCVEPLITAMWDQGSPFYNQCPMDGDRRALTGCAATSLAQVFNKWKYPTQPTPTIPGYTTTTRHFELPALPSVTFDWDHMLDTYRVGYYNADNINAVATLMRYIGQAEQMDYVNDGSTAWEDDIVRACHMFGYVGAYVSYKSELISSTVDNVLIDDETWSQMIQNELLAGRPVVYCGYSWSDAYNMFYGHAFNVDGYDATTGLFSINWGWAGTGNGYYALNAFANQGNNYNMGQLMVMGIEPPAPIEAYAPVMQPAAEQYISLTSFRADWTDETPSENVTSYTLEVTTDDGTEPGVYERVFSETFPYASENGSRPLSDVDKLSTNKGWSSSNAYEARGGIRLGGGGNPGILTTPAVDMTQSGGKMTVMLSMRPYQSADNNIPVTVSCGSSVESVTVTAEGTYTVVLKCDADANQKVTITGGDGSNTKRVVVTQIDIYSATANSFKQLLTLPVEDGDSTSRVITGITDKFYTVRNLSAGGTFNYRVKAHYVNGTQSEWSNLEQVTLFGNAHDYERGDVNHDATVNISDVTALIDYLLGTQDAVCTTCADVNGDGIINISDVTMLIDAILK